jgi:hypothetical protein
MDPAEIVFWGVMSLGVIVGFVLAYPANVWMVARSLKHGPMTERSGSGRLSSKKKSGGKGSGAHDHQPNAAQHKSGHGMATDATIPQLAAVGGVSFLALLLGMVAPANWVNLGLSVRDVGGLIMARGMIMDRDTPGETMRDMAAIHPRLVTARYGMEVRGDRELAPRPENGVKVFGLETSVIRWTILPDITVDAYAFNGQVPGPRLRFRQGDRVRINVTNRLPESTSVHWHGLILPNIMDGPVHITQKPIEKGQVYRYEFTAIQLRKIDRRCNRELHLHRQPFDGRNRPMI